MSFTEEDEEDRIQQALSSVRLEGLKVTVIAEQLIRKVAAGLISSEQAIQELNEYYNK